jgi:hypothetical protein
MEHIPMRKLAESMNVNFKSAMPNNADTKESIAVRKYFPEAWLFDNIELDENGNETEFNEYVQILFIIYTSNGSFCFLFSTKCTFS